MRPDLALAAVFALAAAACALTPDAGFAQARGNAQAEQGRELREREAGRGMPSAGRYASDGGQSFIFDRSGGRPLLRFEQSTEIWVLRAAPAPRGDVIYRNDAGDQVLRVTPDGGMTLYTPDHPGGVPVAMRGSAERLRPTPLTVVQLAGFLIRQSYLASRALGRIVEVEAPDVGPGSEVATAEGTAIAVEAVVRMTRSDSLRSRVTALRRILILPGERPGASFASGTLTITIAPQLGVAGRPSSVVVVRAFGD